MDGKVKIFGKRLVFIEKERLSNVQKITSAENLRSRAFDEIKHMLHMSIKTTSLHCPFLGFLAIELNKNCNRKIAEVIF